MRIWKSRLLLPLLLATAIYAHSLPSRRSTPASAQESSNLTYQSSASEVRVVFFATDEHDRPVEVLQQDDFAVIDDETVIREFRSFTRSAPSKLDVTVLMDFSESVLPQLQQETTNVLHLIALWPWSPGDKLSVLSFNGTEAHVICAGTCRSLLTADQFGSLRVGGSTPLFDALEIATNALVQRSQPEIWPVIILFSDGEDTISKASFQGVLEKILAGGVQVYAIDIGRPGQLSSGTATLQRIADDSGGRYLRIGEGAAKIFNDVIADLHSARVVAYALPVSSSDFHSIRILPTRNLNLQFRSRRGYYHHSGNAY
jgi:VWFA-related protein